MGKNKKYLFGDISGRQKFRLEGFLATRNSIRQTSAHQKFSYTRGAHGCVGSHDTKQNIVLFMVGASIKQNIVSFVFDASVKQNIVSFMFDASVKQKWITQIILNIVPFMLDASVKQTRIAQIILNIMSWGLQKGLGFGHGNECFLLGLGFLKLQRAIHV